MTLTMRQFSRTPARGAARRAAGRARGGFTLIEISMVLLLFAAAVGGLLSFFPVGLRLEANAVSDSAQTMFALNVLGQVEANAAEITDWNVWNDRTENGKNNRFLKEAFKGIEVEGKTLTFDFKSRSGENYYNHRWITDPANATGLSSRDNWRYVVQCAQMATPIYFGRGSGSARDNYKIRRISIWVTDHRDGNPMQSTPFVRDLVFCGDVARNLSNGGN